MLPDCLQYRLTNEEQSFFNEQGYFVVNEHVERCMASGQHARQRRNDRRAHSAHR